MAVGYINGCTGMRYPYGVQNNMQKLPQHPRQKKQGWSTAKKVVFGTGIAAALAIPLILAIKKPASVKNKAVDAMTELADDATFVSLCFMA